LVDGGAAKGDDAPLVGSSGRKRAALRIDAWVRGPHGRRDLRGAVRRAAYPVGRAPIPEVAAHPHLWDRQMLVRWTTRRRANVLARATIKI